MTRLADGDRSAFEPVFEILWPRLRSAAVVFLSDRAAAEDAAQQALLRILAHAGRFDARRRAMPWALGVLVNECRRARRAGRRRREQAMAETAAEWPDRSVSPEDTAIADDLAEALRETLATLGDSDRETLLAAAADRASAGAGVRPATFRKRLQRALERLRRAWGEDHGNL